MTEAKREKKKQYKTTTPNGGIQIKRNGCIEALKIYSFDGLNLQTKKTPSHESLRLERKTKSKKFPKPDS